MAASELGPSPQVTQVRSQNSEMDLVCVPDLVLDVMPAGDFPGVTHPDCKTHADPRCSPTQHRHVAVLLVRTKEIEWDDASILSAACVGSQADDRCGRCALSKQTGDLSILNEKGGDCEAFS